MSERCLFGKNSVRVVVRKPSTFRKQLLKTW
jgi:hypothetical protein